MNKLVNFENIYKLVTKEDSFHVHKILGLFVLCHYFYRYVYFFINGHMNFQTTTDMKLILLHGLLSFSSLDFRIPKIRNPQQPMIYPEYRMHSIIFALRSIGCCFVYGYSPLNYKYIITICVSTMIAADGISFYYNPKGKNGSTMRNMPFDKSISIEEQQKITMMHSYSQIGATLFMFGNIETAFSPMFAIQIAAFLMTLVRKGIINSHMWHFLYSVSLWINYLLFTSMKPGCFLLILSLFRIHYHIVFPCKINKYLAWGFHFAGIICYKEWGYENQVNIFILDNYKIQWNWFVKGFIAISYISFLYRYRILFPIKNNKTDCNLDNGVSTLLEM